MIKTTTFALFLSLSTSTVYASDCNSLNDVKMLLGNWASHSEKLIITEQWRQLDEQHMVGSSTTVNKSKKDKPPFVESLRLIEMSGEVFYLAKPTQNKMPTPFKLTSCEGSKLRFENPKHDFPKVIEYVKEGEKGLRANVTDGAGKGFAINYVRQ